jgi:hypothetical protein
VQLLGPAQLAKHLQQLAEIVRSLADHAPRRTPGSAAPMVMLSL